MNIKRKMPNYRLYINRNEKRSFSNKYPSDDNNQIFKSKTWAYGCGTATGEGIPENMCRKNNGSGHGEHTGCGYSYDDAIGNGYNNGTGHG